MNLLRTLVVVLSVISISLGFFSYKLNEKNKNFDETKNFRHEWSESQESLATYWKDSGKLANLFIDRNFDNNFEIANSYFTYGKLHQTFVDKNENGVYEKYSIFNLYSKKVGKGNDTDEDGAIDRFTFILKNGNELEFIDSDFDGYFEKVILKDDKEVLGFQIEDLFKQKKPS